MVPRDEKGRIVAGARLNPGGRPKLDPLVVEALAAANLPAAQRLALLSQDEDPKVALAACIAILDRNGHRPIDKLELSQDPDAPLSPHEPLTLHELKAIARAQLEKEKSLQPAEPVK